ncbi:hypothetical protein [Hyphomicrobium sp. D-2]|uniref:hypothetical protein n=1 Tax=Hyphomicrobium sp. D-2 TaxID=3041621 RepID=UPI002453CF13|nr:hypothetical protein [Hyphomicrobium sp. D-2]MDH4980704.1 hypothetical protein [Hyphomicrobium sp. D-2]
MIVTIVRRWRLNKVGQAALFLSSDELFLSGAGAMLNSNREDRDHKYADPGRRAVFLAILILGITLIHFGVVRLW